MMLESTPDAREIKCVRVIFPFLSLSRKKRKNPSRRMQLSSAIFTCILAVPDFVMYGTAYCHV